MIFCFLLDDFSQITTDFCNISTTFSLATLQLVTTEKTEICLFVCLLLFEVAFLFLGKKSHYVQINAYAYNQTPLTLSGNDSSVYFSKINCLSHRHCGLSIARYYLSFQNTSWAKCTFCPLDGQYQSRLQVPMKRHWKFEAFCKRN